MDFSALPSGILQIYITIVTGDPLNKNFSKGLRSISIQCIFTNKEASTNMLNAPKIMHQFADTLMAGLQNL